MPWQNFQSLQVTLPSPSARRRRYSVTSDILAYERCSIQYGAFAARKYEPANAIELFYGTVIHQVLDRAHAHYRGIIGPGVLGSIPTNSDIEDYFEQVENSLRARRIYAVASVRGQALEIIQRFNELEGPMLYPRVINTECRLQADQTTYILHGNVDVLARVNGPADEVEIWDYKGSAKPSMGDPNYQQYVFQMQVYAELYRRQTGATPKRAILYFLNELAGPVVPTTRPINALLEVPVDASSVATAMGSFSATVQAIEKCKASSNWVPPILAPPQTTCDACDLRWNCTAAQTFSRIYNLTYP